MFKNQTNIVLDREQSVSQKNRLDEILKSIDGLIFAVKMDANAKEGNGAKPLEYSAQEMMAKKDILFNLLPKEELYAVTKRKAPTPKAPGLPMN